MRALLQTLFEGLRSFFWIFLNQRVGGVAFCLLAACALPQIDPLDLPVVVAEAVPSDIDMSEVNRDPDGCYFYTFAGELILVRDRSGVPICVKPQ